MQLRPGGSGRLRIPRSIVVAVVASSLFVPTSRAQKTFPAGDDAGYAFFSTTLGPVVAVERVTGQHSALSARLGVPVLALVGRPYSVFYALYDDPRPTTDGVRLRLATVDAFQAADFAAAYTTGVRHGADLVVGYHLVAERYRDTRPFRFASQGMFLALALRLGGGQ